MVHSRLNLSNGLPNINEKVIAIRNSADVMQAFYGSLDAKLKIRGQRQELDQKEGLD